MPCHLNGQFGEGWLRPQTRIDGHIANEFAGYAQAFRGYQFPGFHASSDDWIQ